MKQVGSEEARRRFRDLLDDAQRGEPVKILRHDKLVAVLVPANWYYAPAEVIWPAADHVEMPKRMVGRRIVRTCSCGKPWPCAAMTEREPPSALETRESQK